MTDRMRLRYIVLAAAFIIFINAGVAYAGLSVTPERHTLELMPNEESIVEYQIRNSGTEDIHIAVESEYWAKTKEDEKIDIDSWLMPQEDSFDIKADDTKTLKVKVKAPENVKGEMVAMIFFCYKEKKDSPLNIRNGNPLYMLVKGTGQYAAEIRGIGLKYFKDPKRHNKKCLQVSVSIENTGNIHFKPDIDLLIKGRDGKALKKLELKDGWPVFKKQSYRYNLQWWNPTLEENKIYKMDISAAYKDKLKKVKREGKFKFANGKATIIE